MVLAQLPQGKSPPTLTNPNFNPGGEDGGQFSSGTKENNFISFQ